MAAELFRHEAQDGSVEAVIQYAAQLNNLGLCLGKLNRYGDAVVHLDGAATIIEDFLPNSPGLGQYYAATLASLAGALAEIGEFDQAMTTREQVIGFWSAPFFPDVALQAPLGFWVCLPSSMYSSSAYGVSLIASGTQTG